MDESEISLRIIDSQHRRLRPVPAAEDVPLMNAGVTLQDVRIELDDDTKLEITLRLQHVTSINDEGRGVRLGFEFVRLGGDSCARCSASST